MTHDPNLGDLDLLQAYLDGDVDLAQLPEEQRAHAQAWTRLLGAARREMPPVSAPAWLEDRVMAEIEELSTPGPLRQAWQWLVSPQPVRLPPWGWAVVLGGLALLFNVQGGGEDPANPLPPQTGAPVVYVQFNLAAPQAQSVSVGGDFDGWQASHALSDEDGDGIWTGRIALEPGVHAYMFLVDESEWVTDPLARRYADDGFGNQNALLALTDPRT